ncbi:unnamed protein product [Mytilus edulis]|uniref:SOCS box domain-containing protein n=1 Tax=Mytilus edulis TaxID=6550 RepID=A0A8S3RE44_MYTED|nr:unnamed protein product [Mytilus edulis]
MDLLGFLFNMGAGHIENERTPSARGTRPKSSKSAKKTKNGLKKNNIDEQTKFALSIQMVNPEIRALVKNYPPISEQTAELFECIRQKNYVKVKKLIKSKDCDKNGRDVEDPLFPTPLIVASELDDTEMVKLLVGAKRPANVNDENLHGRRPVWIAARNKNTEIMELLVEGNQECQVNFTDREKGTSPLFEAVIGSCPDVARILIHARADVNMRKLGQENGPDTPLTKAIQQDNKEIVQLLLNSLAKMKSKSENGLTALHYAVAYKRYDICEVLLEHGAKLHARTNSGVTALAVAIENHNPAMVRILLDYGYKMDKKFKWKETPLQQAIFMHADNCAMTLLHYGCSIKKEKGPSYFWLAVNEKLIKLVKFMIALKPVFLNEPWITKEDWPVSIYHRPDIFEWLKKESRKVRPLMFHCRAQIYGYLGRHPKNKIHELPLPDKLKEYLHYNEYIKDQYFVKKPLDVRECPFDCPSLCPVPHCPPIEVSSESDTDSGDNIESENEDENEIKSKFELNGDLESEQSDQNSQRQQTCEQSCQKSTENGKKQKRTSSAKKSKTIKIHNKKSDVVHQVEKN